MFFKSYGLLGQNGRNLEYIKWYNTGIAKKLADSKLKTKQFLSAKGVKVPETLSIIKNHESLTTSLIEALNPPFVVKPNNGFWGKGILVFSRRDAQGSCITNMGEVYSAEKLKFHCSDILDGFFSLSWFRDTVIIEKKIILDAEIELIGTYGLPDIRVIVFNMVPVMAMLRVPTEKSWGKANLHGGACGVGIDIGTGRLTYITQHSKIIKSIPGIWDIRGLRLPKWDEILTMAVRVQQVTGLGYLGCDIVLDEKEGPLLLEMNARAGLELQVANLAPLRDRLDRVEGIYIQTVEKGVRVGKDLFSGDLEEKIKSISGKKVLGDREYITLLSGEKKHTYLAELKLHSTSNFLDSEFVEHVLKIPTEGKETLRLVVQISWEEKQLKFIVKQLGSVNIILGTSALKGFLIDPYKYKKGETPTPHTELQVYAKNIAIRKNYEQQLQAVDTALHDIDKRLLILKYVTPVNIEAEKQVFMSTEGKHIPQFEYADFPFDIDDLESRLRTIEVPEIPLGGIFARKKEEIGYKLQLLRAVQGQNVKDFNYYGKKVYGQIMDENMDMVNDALSRKESIEEEKEFLTLDEIEKYIKKFNHIYGNNIRVESSTGTARFAMKWDVLLCREGAMVGKRELRSIIAHEIEGHYLRKINGGKLGYHVFTTWTAWYLEYDEWIAIYNQNRFLSERDRKYFGIFERYYFVHYATKHSYDALFKKMKEYYGDDYERIFNYILRLKRWLEDVTEDAYFMKDVVYINGYQKVETALSLGMDLKELYVGKVTEMDVQDIKNAHMLDVKFNELTVPFFL